MPELSVRLSQTLAPFGVGAIYDVLGESFVACDIGVWKGRGDPLRSPRLERKLRVKQLKVAPARASLFGKAGGPGVPFFRFPRWLFCARCRRMTFWESRAEVEGQSPRCQACTGRRRPLVPMRFVLVCRDGHLADVPWHRWAHSQAESPDQKQCQGGPLFFRSHSQGGSGLASLRIECGVDRCRAGRSLAGISAPGSMRQLGVTCRGLQPWEFPDQSKVHDLVPEVVQRGASNVHFATVESAIDIPPESRHSAYGATVLAVTSTPHFGVIATSPSGPMVAGLVAGIAKELGVPVSEVQAIVDQELRGTIAEVISTDPDDLLGAEWQAFITPQEEVDSRDRFVTRHVQIDGSQMGYRQWAAARGLVEMFDHIVLATRLREVRALTGFARLEPGGTQVRPDLGRGLDWLPGLEVFGEGIFLSLREDALQRWEEGPAAERIAAMAVRRSGSRLSHWLPPATPRFVLLHTLAHLLMRQLAFDSGYSSASLRERIYAREPGDTGTGQAGILVYTAAGDAEGTLGGLVRLGEPERLAPSLLAMLQRALWCSNDPICRDSPGQGTDALNRAACHACALASETSCVHSNALLDRSVLVGSEDPSLSFFESELRLALDRSAGGSTG